MSRTKTPPHRVCVKERERKRCRPLSEGCLVEKVKVESDVRLLEISNLVYVLGTRNTWRNFAARIRD